MSAPPKHPATLGLFQKRFEGDDSLMVLARLRFRQAGMGTEIHASAPHELDWLMNYLPSPGSPVVVHLARDLNWTDEFGQDRITELAERFAGRVRGLVVHDQLEMGERPEAFLIAARALETRLARIERGPVLFIEYAAGLEPDVFGNFIGSLRDLTRVSACIDVGHVGIRQVRKAYAEMHPGADVCALKSELPKLPGMVAEVELAVASALPEVLKLIEALARLGKPLHFHLHDGHPLSSFSPFGVSDHMSFLAHIPIAFEHRGRWSLPLMFGPAGLAAIVREATAAGSAQDSFTLEIHPPAGRLPLGDSASLFTHWRDKTTAEQMNHWLTVLGENHNLLLAALNLKD